jgi:hypothetical protein
MKKSLLFIAIAAGMVTMVGCTQNKSWGESERDALRNELRAYRDMVYLDDLAEVEFNDFSGDVIEAVEVDYPVYTVFYELPGRGDTLDVYVVSTIVERLDDNPHNLRHIYPYSWLVTEGILPAGLDHQAERAFYDCLSHKVKRHYHSSRKFINALLNDPNASNTIANMQMECAAELFDWGITTIEIDEMIESTPSATTPTTTPSATN